MQLTGPRPGGDTVPSAADRDYGCEDEPMNGDELVRRIALEYPEICTIVFSGYDDYKYERDVLKNNAIDYLIKNDPTPELLLESLHKAEEILKTGPGIEKG